MGLSANSAAILLIASAVALGFGVAIAVFCLMAFGFCGCSRSGLVDGHHHRRRGRFGSRERESTTGDEAGSEERGCKGIPLNSRPPRLTPEQVILREKAMEKYRRRQARQERRRERQAAREAQMLNAREGGGKYTASVNDFDDNTSVSSRTTLTSAATTVRTASTVAYGRSTYLPPPPAVCEVQIDAHDEDDELRSAYSGDSRRSSRSARSRNSEGTIASIKSYLRRRQRQRLRRREKQPQMEMFNQWAEEQMATSSELSLSSISSTSLREENTTGRNARYGTETMLGGQSLDLSTQQKRRMSVASSEPRPPEKVLAVNCVAHAALQGSKSSYSDRPCVGNDNNRASHSIMIHEVEDERKEIQSGYSEYCETAANLCTPHTVAAKGSGCNTDDFGASRVGGEKHVGPMRSPHQKRTWKDVEQSVALSGFFSNAINTSCVAGAEMLPLSQCTMKAFSDPLHRVTGELTKKSFDSHEPILRE